MLTSLITLIFLKNHTYVYINAPEPVCTVSITLTEASKFDYNDSFMVLPPTCFTGKKLFGVAEGKVQIKEALLLNKDSIKLN